MTSKRKQFRWLAAILMLVAAMAVTQNVMAQGTLTYVSSSGGFYADYEEGRESDETANLLFDGDISTKWCYYAPSSDSPAWVVFQASTAGVIGSYTITTGSDNSNNEGRNPKSWKIYGSNDEGENKTWTELVTVTDDNELKDENSKAFTFYPSPASTTAFLYFKWAITACQGDNVFQVSEFSIAYYSSNCKDGNHEGELTLVEAREATCTQKGYSQDFYMCSSCGKCYSDKEGGNEISLASVTTDYAAHQIGSDGEFCTVCHHPQHTGTNEDPIQIGDAKALRYYRDWVNGTYTPAAGRTATKHEGACAKLIADIDMSTVCSASVGTWVPISPSDAIRWSGTFDGDNHTISNLYINGNEQYQGLFGYIANGTIQNVTFDQVIVKSSKDYTGTVVGMASINSSLQDITVNSGTVDGLKYTGGIAGQIIYTHITASCNKASVYGTDKVGGICGYYKDASVSKCSNYASVKGIFFVGGICGYTYNNITNCANYGDVSGCSSIGGIAGCFAGVTMDNLLTTGSVAMSNTKHATLGKIGMIVGGVSNQNDNITLTNIVGYNSSASMTINGTKVESPSAIGIVEDGVIITGECSAFDTEALASGIAAYLLNTKAAGTSKWGQNLSADAKDAFPLYDSDKQVYLNGDVKLNCIYHLLSGSLTNDANSTGTLAETKTHGDIVTTSKAATCVKTGLSEHHECSLCHTIFTDANGTEVKTDLSDITLAATGVHDWDEDVTVRECKNHCCHFKVELNSGTEADPHLIYSAEELNWFANWVNGDLTLDENYQPIYHADAHAKLMADIVVNENVLDAEGNLNTAQAKFFNSWYPICWFGRSDYTGVFDGQGHTVSGLYYLTNDSESGYALFGINKGTIKNVGVADTYFQAMSTVSGICADNKGTIDNCFSFCTLNANYNIGGICGLNGGTVMNCFSAGKLLLEDYSTRYGGICGDDYTEDNGTTYTPVVTNSYYLSGMAPSAVYGETDTENVKAMTATQFKSGEVCYLLDNGKTDGTQTWYQNLAAEGGDVWPVFKNTGSNTVYSLNDYACDGTTVTRSYYSNTSDFFIAPHETYKLADTPDSKGLYDEVCAECGHAKEGIKFVKDFNKTGENLEVAVAQDGTYSVAELTLYDNSEARLYNSPVELKVGTLHYTRSYSHNGYAPLYVPFAMSQSDWDEQFDLFAINNFHERENFEGTGYDVSLEVKRITSGTTIANRPYVIRPKSYSEENPVMTIDMTDATLKPKQNCSISCSSMSYTYTFNGIYDETTLRTDASLMDYAMSGGSIMLAAENTALSPQRWYLHVTSRDGYEEGGSSSSFAAISRSISIDVTGDTEMTGIEDIRVVNTSSDGSGIYDLTGRKLAKEPVRGMYIKNGKKFIK